LIKLLIATYYL